MAGQVPQSADRLANCSERRLVAVWPVLTVTGNPSDHEAGIDLVQDVGADLQTLQLPRPKVLHQHIGAGGKLQQDVTILFQVEFDRELVAPVNAEPNGMAVLGRAPAAEGIAAGRFQLDHLGAEVGEDAGAEWRGDIMADFQNFQPDQRQIAHAPASLIMKSPPAKNNVRDTGKNRRQHGVVNYLATFWFYIQAWRRSGGVLFPPPKSRTYYSATTYGGTASPPAVPPFFIHRTPIQPLDPGTRVIAALRARCGIAWRPSHGGQGRTVWAGRSGRDGLGGTVGAELTAFPCGPSVVPNETQGRENRCGRPSSMKLTIR